MFGHSLDRNHEFVSGPCHDGGESVIHRAIATNSPTKGDGPIDLLSGRKGSFKFNVLNPFGFWQGWGEARKISVDLRWSGGWLCLWE
jgi:hypothetical protein